MVSGYRSRVSAANSAACRPVPLASISQVMIACRQLLGPLHELPPAQFISRRMEVRVWMAFCLVAGPPPLLGGDGASQGEQRDHEALPEEGVGRLAGAERCASAQRGLVELLAKALRDA